MFTRGSSGPGAAHLDPKHKIIFTSLGIRVVENIPHPNGEIVDIDINDNEEDDEPTKH